MKFSLIVATYGRVDEIKKLLDSLLLQSIKDIEIIIVDQNDHDDLKEIIKAYSQLNILFIKSKPGISRARNVGLNSATGNIIAFPDDDCWYSEGLLEKVEEIFKEDSQLSILSGTWLGPDGEQVKKYSSHKKPINKKNIWDLVVSITFFVRAKALGQEDRFDESLGVGAESGWHSGEETDFVLRLIEKGKKALFDPSLPIYHPHISTMDGSRKISRGRTYGRGFGRVLRKHRYSMASLMYYLSRSAAGFTLNFILSKRNEASFHYNVLLGRIEGWRGQR